VVAGHAGLIESLRHGVLFSTEGPTGIVLNVPSGIYYWNPSG
jgi:hypothetical protein